jgi:hypothetical protein
LFTYATVETYLSKNPILYTSPTPLTHLAGAYSYADVTPQLVKQGTFDVIVYFFAVSNVSQQSLPASGASLAADPNGPTLGVILRTTISNLTTGQIDLTDPTSSTPEYGVPTTVTVMVPSQVSPTPNSTSGTNLGLIRATLADVHTEVNGYYQQTTFAQPVTANTVTQAINLNYLDRLETIQIGIDGYLAEASGQLELVAGGTVSPTWSNPNSQTQQCNVGLASPNVLSVTPTLALQYSLANSYTPLQLHVSTKDSLGVTEQFTVSGLAPNAAGTGSTSASELFDQFVDFPGAAGTVLVKGQKNQVSMQEYLSDGGSYLLTSATGLAVNPATASPLTFSNPCSIAIYPTASGVNLWPLSAFARSD